MKNAFKKSVMMIGIVLCGLILLSLSFISASLGTFKSGECVPIITNLNASSVTISVLTNPTPNPAIVLTNVTMTKIGNSFNYTFCDTTKIGTYTYGYCDNSGNCYSNDFYITAQGWTSTAMFYFIFILIICLIMFAGYTLKNNWILWLGSILVLLLGFFIIINGIDVIKNTQTTWGIAIIVWALGIYFIFLCVEETLKLWG